MKSIIAISTAILVSSIVFGVVSVAADSSTSTPVNSINAIFNPITTTVSYNYDFLTGALTSGTATATAMSIGNIFMTVVNDPAPPDPSNGATLFGTARPVHFQGDEVVYQQSVCADGYPSCLSDGSLTFGGFVMRNVRGDALGQLTELASLYYIQSRAVMAAALPDSR
jgi:hypothetical protein